MAASAASDPPTIASWPNSTPTLKANSASGISPAGNPISAKAAENPNPWSSPKANAISAGARRARVGSAFCGRRISRATSTIDSAMQISTGLRATLTSPSVVALVLLIGGWQRLIASVTAFTVAHSITLAATALGLMSVARKPVEICIALSIVLVAREILRPPDSEPTLARRAPALIAFAFGLLHGFGFAAALAEIGLPAGEIPLALFAFNVGVELGQLAIVAATLAALAAFARFAAQWQRPATVAGAYAIGAVASAWLIQRTLL